MLYYNLVDAQLSQLGLQGKTKRTKMRTQRSSSSGGRVRNIRRRRQRVGDDVPATHGTRRQPASGTRNRPSSTSSRRTRRAFRNRAVRQTAVRHQAAHSVRNQEPTVADEQLSYSSDVPEPRRASDGGDETTGTATCSAVVG